MRSLPRRALLTAIVPVAVLVPAGCSGANDHPPSIAEVAASVTTTSPLGEGTIHVKLEEIEGMLTEGFELSVQLEAPSGHRLVSSTWQQLVNDQHETPTGDDFYDTVVTTTVPAGEFVLTTVMHPGMEAPQEPCVTSGQVEPGGSVTVSVKFSNLDGCAVVS